MKQSQELKKKYSILKNGQIIEIEMTQKEAYHLLIEQLKEFGDVMIDSKLTKPSTTPIQILEAVFYSYLMSMQAVSQTYAPNETKQEYKDNLVPFNKEDDTKKTFH